MFPEHGLYERGSPKHGRQAGREGMDGRENLVVLSREEGGSRWRFASPDESLLSALVLPLESQPDPSHLCYFSATDPWRSQPRLLDLCGWLAERQEPLARSTSCTEDASLCQMRDGLGIHVAAATGRGIVLGGKCPRGALLLQEEAHAAVLYRAHHRTHCHFCLRPLSLSQPVFRCHTHGCEVYCGDTCRDRAWDCGHDAECGVRYASFAPPTALLCIRALLRHATNSVCWRPSTGDASEGGAGHLGTESVPEPEKQSSHVPAPSLGELQSHASSFNKQHLSRLRLHAFVGHRVLNGPLEERRASEQERLRCARAHANQRRCYISTTPPCHAIPFHATPHRTAPHHTTPHHATPHRTAPHRTTSQAQAQQLARRQEAVSLSLISSELATSECVLAAACSQHADQSSRRPLHSYIRPDDTCILQYM